MTDNEMNTNTEEESAMIRDLKASLKRATFHVNIREDQIIVYHFDNLSRAVLIQWVDYVRHNQEKMKPPVRVLFDLRGSGPPSRFMADRLPGILAEMEIIEDTRSAFLVDDDLNGRFTRSALDNMPVAVGETQIFLNLSPAIKWLLS